MQPKLECILYQDLYPWERDAFMPLFDRLSQSLPLEIMEANRSHTGLAKNLDRPAWIIARDWRNALTFLGANHRLKHRTFVSVMELASPRENIYRVLMKKIVGAIHPGISLVVHSPLNYRFFTELEKVPMAQVKFFPLPFVQAKRTPRETVVRRGGPLTVGTFGGFVTDSHLNYAVSIAHYLVNKDPEVRFRFLGQGPYYAHTARMVKELGIGERVFVTETVDTEEMRQLDVLLYGPLRNDHFLPIYFAGARELPTLANELPGVEEFIQDSHSGFVVSVDEVKSMGELILRVLRDDSLRLGLGKRLCENLNSRFHLDKIAPLYLEWLTGKGSQTQRKDQAA